MEASKRASVVARGQHLPLTGVDWESKSKADTAGTFDWNLSAKYYSYAFSSQSYVDIAHRVVRNSLQGIGIRGRMSFSISLAPP